MRFKQIEKCVHCGFKELSPPYLYKQKSMYVRICQKCGVMLNVSETDTKRSEEGKKWSRNGFAW